MNFPQHTPQELCNLKIRPNLYGKLIKKTPYFVKKTNEELYESNIRSNFQPLKKKFKTEYTHHCHF